MNVSSSVPGPEPRLGIEPDLETALNAVSSRERELIAMRFGADLTGPQIAELTGLTLEMCNKSSRARCAGFAPNSRRGRSLPEGARRR